MAQYLECCQMLAHFIESFDKKPNCFIFLASVLLLLHLELVLSCDFVKTFVLSLRQVHNRWHYRNSRIITESLLTIHSFTFLLSFKLLDYMKRQKQSNLLKSHKSARSMQTHKYYK